MSICYFRCQASTDHTTYQNKNNLNKNNLLCLYDYQYCCCYLDLLELEQSRNISVGYTNLIHLIQMRSYKSLNDIPTIHVTITITNKWNRTVDAFCVSNAILEQMINGWLKKNQFPEFQGISGHALCWNLLQDNGNKSVNKKVPY